MAVHNHGPDEGRGLDCPEQIVNKRLRGACMPKKHVLRVARDEVDVTMLEGMIFFEGVIFYPPIIYFKCENCPKYLIIERSTLEGFLTRQTRVGELGDWSVCRG